MIFAVSTRWNAGRHTRGEAMIEEILNLGLSHVELGYDLRIDLVPGVVSMATSNSVTVTSVHNFCPVPVGAPRGHPELFTLADSDPRVRESAVHHTIKTIDFAQSVGAKAIVVHAGNVEMTRMSQQLVSLWERGEQYGRGYEKTKMKLQMAREKKAPRQIAFLREAIAPLLSHLDGTGMNLCLENLPTWEAIPSEFEMESLCRDFSDRGLRYWHDIGHGQIRENLGFINQERWLERLQPYLAGMHIHDVMPPAFDHLMPPVGKTNFIRLKRFSTGDIIRVLEPAPDTPGEHIVEAVNFLRKSWEESEPAMQQTHGVEQP